MAVAIAGSVEAVGGLLVACFSGDLQAALAVVWELRAKDLAPEDIARAVVEVARSSLLADAGVVPPDSADLADNLAALRGLAALAGPAFLRRAALTFEEAGLRTGVSGYVALELGVLGLVACDVAPWDGQDRRGGDRRQGEVAHAGAPRASAAQDPSDELATRLAGRWEEIVKAAHEQPSPHVHAGLRSVAGITTSGRRVTLLVRNAAIAEVMARTGAVGRIADVLEHVCAERYEVEVALSAEETVMTPVSLPRRVWREAGGEGKLARRTAARR